MTCWPCENTGKANEADRPVPEPKCQGSDNSTADMTWKTDIIILRRCWSWWLGVGQASLFLSARIKKQSQLCVAGLRDHYHLLLRNKLCDLKKSKECIYFCHFSITTFTLIRLFFFSKNIYTLSVHVLKVNRSPSPPPQPPHDSSHKPGKIYIHITIQYTLFFNEWKYWTHIKKNNKTTTEGIAQITKTQS